eukprot:COSAG03_NODE_2688_length_2525_cov_1.620775_2_plen_253_part_00
MAAGAQTKIISQAKHCCAYDYGGRDGEATLLDERSIFEVYLRPWQRAIAEAGLRGAMASHNSLNYEPMHGSKRWLTHMLREELGFGDGYIGADSHNVLALAESQHVAASVEDAAILAVTAGLDQDLNTMQGTPYCTLVESSANSSDPSTAELRAAIDRAAGNVLRLKFAAGLFDDPIVDEALWSARNAPADRELAKEASLQGMVLLKNNGVLPLAGNSGIKKIAVIGPNADDLDSTLGDYNPNGKASEDAGE